MIAGLGKPHHFFSVADSLGEVSELGETEDQIDAPEEWSQAQASDTRVLADQAVRGRCARPENMGRLPIVTSGPVRRAQERVRKEPERRIVQVRSNGQGALTRLDGPGQVTLESKILNHEGLDPGDLSLVVRGF
jgi:hypothetical protein